MKIKLLVAVLIWFFVFQNGICQNPLVKQWDKRFGGKENDWLGAFQQTADGGYILGGFSQSGIGGNKTQGNLGYGDYWLVKINPTGVKEWDKVLGGTKPDELNSLQQTADGGYILGGSSKSGISADKTQANWDASLTTFDYWIVKTDSLGNKQWDKTFGGTNNDELYSVQQTDDGGYILGGSSNSGISGDKTQPNWDTTIFTYDYWIVKTDSFGNKQWDKTFGGTYTDHLYTLEQTADGGYILGGYAYSGISGDKTQPSWGWNDYWIIKTDSLGSKQWDKDFGGTEVELFSSLQQTADGGYILGGLSRSGISGDKTQPSWDTASSVNWRGDYWIVKIDPIGNKQWDKRFGGASIDYFSSLSPTTDGGYLMAGTSNSDSSGDKTENNLSIWSQTWIVKINSLGIKQWDKTIFTIGWDGQSMAIQSADGCYVVANTTDGGIGGYKTQPAWNNSDDYWIIKFCDSTLATSISNFQIPNSKFQISPNPATDKTHISFPAMADRNAEIKIYSITGEKVFEEKIIAPIINYQLTTVNFRNGIYFLNIQTEKEIVTRKIIVNH